VGRTTKRIPASNRDSRDIGVPFLEFNSTGLLAL
jgi:hypothetical protein